MIQAFFLSLGQLFDPRVAWVFLKSLAVTILLFLASAVAVWFGLRLGLPALGQWLAAHGGQSGILGSISAALVGTSADSSFADVVTIVLMLLAHWLLFRVIAIGVMDVFADDVVVAVEAKHYPAAHDSARDLPLARSIGMGLGSAGRTIFINLLLSPAYLMLILTGVGTPILFFAVNSWLLGRDLGDMVAVRHMPASRLRQWRGRTRFGRLMLGAIGTALFLVPVLNLIAPVIGAAMATHLFHRGRRA